jgi:MerR family regulatory protein
MRISEVSRRTGVSIRSLRYYEQKRLLCARRLSNGYRDLDEEAVTRVQTIRMYLGPGGIAGLGTEILSIHLLDAGSTSLLSYILTDRYDAQGRPIPERFARYEELKRRYGRGDGQEVVTCGNGTLQR